MKLPIKITTVFLSFVLSFACLSCGKTPDPNDTLVVPDGYTCVTVGKQAGINVFGSSVEFDPHFFSANVTKRVCDEADWQIVKRRVAAMGIHRFRVMLLPSWIEPVNDNDDVNSIDWDNLTPDSREMYSLYQVLDLAEENGIDVNLTLWGVENGVSLVDVEQNAAVAANGGHFLAKGNEAQSNWIIGTVHPEEFAENFSIYLQHLRKKGYTCIREITPVNEPDGDYLVGGRVDFSAYKQMCLALDARLRADGIRDSVRLIVSDNVDTRRWWLEQTVNELDAIADGYSSHTYLFGYQSTNAQIERWEEENLNLTLATGKPHVIGEFGSNLNSGATRQADIDLFERGVLMVRQLCNFYNAGAAGASYWILFDQYYNYKNAYSGLMMLGLWKSSKLTYREDSDYYDGIGQDYEVRPQFYAYSLFSKHVPKGATVYPIALRGYDYAVGTAFKGTDGKWTYVFANGEGEQRGIAKIALQNGNAYGSFDRYVYRKDALPATDALIASEGSNVVRGQVLCWDLAPNTVVVFKQR